MFDRRKLLKSLCTGLPLTLAQSRPSSSNLLQSSGPTRIWDVHFHLGSVPGETPEERMTQLIKFADRLGIDRLIVSLGFPFDSDPSPQQLRDRNDQVLRVLRGWPDRVFGFVYLNPNQLDASLQEFDRCVRDGPMGGGQAVDCQTLQCART
jgi:predicted TIM-barrel fold metal-dependent hydrolase